MVQLHLHDRTPEGRRCEASGGSSMGYDAERAEELADEYKAGLINADGSPVDDFDTPDEYDGSAAPTGKP